MPPKDNDMFRKNFKSLFLRCFEDIAPHLEAHGIVAGNKVYPIGSDTKVLSTIFELMMAPLLYDLADSHGLKVVESVQTVYPDFTIMTSVSDRQKIAVDIKTTYRRPRIQFTLGSYTSFLRNGVKNIIFPYDQYVSHWIIGFVYDRCPVAADRKHIYDAADVEKIQAPYCNVEMFIQEKFRISGERPGSGNTTNIGSIAAETIEPFKQGSGPFASLGETVFREYWANYGTSSGGRTYNNVKEFMAWKCKQ